MSAYRAEIENDDTIDAFAGIADALPKAKEQELIKTIF